MKIEDKASEIKAASLAVPVTELSQIFILELVEQRKELSNEKGRLQAQRQQLEQNLGGGQCLISTLPT